MAELTKKRNAQPTSCPDGWHPSARVVLIQLTRRQERYTKRAVGIARFVYNRMVANDQDGRDQGLWLTPHELEKEFNTAKHLNQGLQVRHPSQQVRRPRSMPQLPQRLPPVAQQGTESPQTAFPQEEPHRHRLVPRRIRHTDHQVRRTPANKAPLPGQRENDQTPPGRHHPL